ncbi:DUF2892 domain-containing protein [Methylicorpusculum oleiharenae]|uniref:YgaP family membrane protein n=1 Tax=Methylicorpusculum oleiharenae TaxID=1338687 RepID=UPI001357D0AC|nr:DUF2892 domain-containing protein [Methylicorpusculum oleiharenae]MCD2450683.1 DUF2892 domain-containing protein [Methylicorpusculum oleiharenae]
MNFDVKRMVKFEHNIGVPEKKYRMFGGAALVLASLFTAKILLIIVGMILIATAYSGWCPVYSGLNKSTLTPDSPAAPESSIEESESHKD